jgi:hypothetical protein
MRHPWLWSFVVCLSVLCAGCSSDNFNPGILESAPVRLDAEYVMLTSNQLQCGSQEDLWEAPAQSGDRSTARLLPKGRALNFADDVSVGDMRQPYVQIRGDFPLKVVDIVNTKDGADKDSKSMEAKVGVIFQHTCFPTPLPIMGVRKGNFTQESAPVFQFRNNGGWQLEKVAH